jgi:cellulose synthase/poly-beta-1,6-N-acetylglucosamine synthase-like glycosyltransferase
MAPLLYNAHLVLTAIAVAMSIPVVVLSIPVAVLLIQVIAALLARRDFPDSPSAAPSSAGTLAVVIPAHDEGENVAPTVQDVLSQLGPRDRLIVVADNCTDDTATVAARAGAQVLVRTDPLRRGKGYALSHAVAELSKAPPDYVAFVDADCRLGEHALRRLQDACMAQRRPVQALYLMKQPPGSPADHRLAEFFWLVRNEVRPLGLRALGLPTQITGSGMVFPWPVIASAPLASGNIVEDLNLGIDLARAGHAAVFVPGAVVTSFFPSSDKGTASQRERWVAGHVQTIWRRLPLLWEAVRRGNKDLFALVLDLMVPPLSLLGLLLLLVLLANAALAVAVGVTAAFIVSAVNVVALAAAIFMAWGAFGREVCSAGAMFRLITGALAARARLYLKLARGKADSAWVRTDRDKHQE